MKINEIQSKTETLLKLKSFSKCGYRYKYNFRSKEKVIWFDSKGHATSSVKAIE